MTKALILLAISGITYGFVSSRQAMLGNSEFSAPLAAEADSYRVIKVNGHIIYTKKGKDMHQGDVFNATESITFKTPDSRAAVISKVNGRKILSPKSKSSKATLLPPMNNISSRSGGLNNLIDLKNHFDGDYLVLGTSKLTINEKSFPMNEQSFFFLKYQYNGEAINKKLSYDGDKLVLDREEIFKVDGEPIDANNIETVELFYLNGKTKTTINSFNLKFGNDEELSAELKIILTELTDSDEKAILDEITSYLNEYYGKPNKSNLKNWYNQHLKG